MVFKLECSSYFSGKKQPIKNAIMTKYHSGLKKFKDGNCSCGNKECNIGDNISEWEIEVNSLEELLNIIDETGVGLIINKEKNTLIIYDGFIE